MRTFSYDTFYTSNRIRNYTIIIGTVISALKNINILDWSYEKNASKRYKCPK